MQPTRLQAVACPTLLVDYSRLNHGSADRVLQPADAAAASLALQDIRDTQTAGTGVTIGGAGRSFGEQAMPVARLPDRVLIKTTAMKDIALLPQSAADVTRNVRRAIVGAGVTFGNLLDTIDTSSQQYMPFSTPTSRHISVAGALSANTHSRTTAARGGYLFDHVSAFVLVTPDLGAVVCRRDAPAGSLAHDLFFAAPGSFGALGLITDVEIELRVMPKTSTVHCATLHVTHDVEGFLAAMQQTHAENRATNAWDEGLFILLHGSPSKGRAAIVGCQAGTARHKSRLSAMPMFAERPAVNAYYHGIGNAFPRLAAYMMKREFGARNAYINDLRSFSYFLTSHDEAHERLKANEPLAASLRVAGIDSDLPTAHQAWVVPTQSLEAFMRAAGELLDGPYASLVHLIEMQDILELPRSKALMSPCKDEYQYLYQFSFIAADKGGPKTKLVRAFFRALSEAAARPEVNAKVSLLKESQCDDALLRAMQEPALSRLRKLKAKTDSRNVLTSALLDRLL